MKNERGGRDTFLTNMRGWVIICLFLASLPSWAGSTGVLAAGDDHACGLKNDGTIVCWGKNSTKEIKPPSGTFTKISGGEEHYCGLKTDASLSCWGNNDKGQASPPAGTYIHVSAGGQHSCATKNDGTAICWGDNAYNQLSVPSGVFTQVTAGYEHSCGLRKDGKVECWGEDDLSQIAEVPAGTFSSITAARYITCALKTDGAAICWGAWATAKTNLGFLSQLDVFSASTTTCGLKFDHNIDCWGAESSVETKKPSGIFTYITAGYLHACALKETGKVVCWGRSRDSREAPTAPDVIFMQPSSKPPPASEFDKGKQAGIQQCVANPASCGIISGGGSAIKLINISTRAPIHGGANDVIAGFIVSGTGSQKVVIRGWSLAAGVNPKITVQKLPSGEFVASNDDWQVQAAPSSAIPAQYAMPQATEAALLLTLPAGAYTAILSSVGAAGLGLIGVDAID
jgi:alpha-tubulin suppressor-like RCC1 family protein